MLAGTKEKMYFFQDHGQQRQDWAIEYKTVTAKIFINYCCLILHMWGNLPTLYLKENVLCIVYG